MAWRVGVDVGGTFTDFFALDEPSGTVVVHKVPSTPANPAAAIVEGTAELLRRAGVPATELAGLSHGTTVATNALIQRKGGRVALITTQGFRDVIEIGRQIRPRLYDLQEDYPAPLVPRARRFELKERVVASGDMLVRPSESDIEEVVREVLASGAEACAVCLLFSFLNPENERRVAEALARAAPDMPVSISCEVQPEFREYERFSTTVLNAYLLSVMSHYLRTLEEEIGRSYPNASVGVNQSSGGLMSVARARRFPVRTALSGPAAGVVGAIHSARLSDRPNMITLDMGGTSADVALIRGYEAGLSFERSIEDFPVRLPMIDINSVGAGGGSIAWFEKDGLLKVGPESAGSVPGPACYARGGSRPTVSDANLVLERLSTKGLLGGGMPLDRELAESVLRPLADRLGFTLERAAHGVISIAVSNMVRAIRAISVERGLDARGFSLLAFGGAGPLHAAEVARGLGLREIIIPFSPGILCAQGLVVSDLTENFVRTTRVRLDRPNAADEIRRHATALLDDAEAWLAGEGLAQAQGSSTDLSLDTRYVGQNFELSIPLSYSRGGDIDVEQLRQAFMAAHEQSYGYYNARDPVEIVNIRAIARARRADPDRARPAADETSAAADEESRHVYFGYDAAVETRVYNRASLRAGDVVRGPAIVEQLDATTVIFPGDVARVDPSLNILIKVNP